MFQVQLKREAIVEVPHVSANKVCMFNISSQITLLPYDYDFQTKSMVSCFLIEERKHHKVNDRHVTTQRPLDNDLNEESLVVDGTM